MPNYKNTVASKKCDFTTNKYESGGNLVTETYAKNTYREQVPDTRPMLTSGGGGSRGGKQFLTHTYSENIYHRTEEPIHGGQQSSGGQGAYGGGHSSGSRGYGGQGGYSSGQGGYAGGQQMVSYDHGQGGSGAAPSETISGTTYERWTTGPNKGNTGGRKGGRY